MSVFPNVSAVLIKRTSDSTAAAIQHIRFLPVKPSKMRFFLSALATRCNSSTPKQRVVCISNRRFLTGRDPGNAARIADGLHYRTRQWKMAHICDRANRCSWAHTQKQLVRYPHRSLQENRPVLSIWFWGFSVLLKSTSAAQMQGRCRALTSASQPLCSWSTSPEWSQWNPYNDAQVSWC